MKNFKSILTICLSVVILMSCDSDFLVKTPPDALPEEGFYNSPERAEAAVNAAYVTLLDLYGEQVFIPFDSPSDDVILSNVTYSSFNTFSFTSSSPQLMETYSEFYEGVYRANKALGEIPDIDMDPDLKERLIGEAKFLRALYYWHLTTAWGEVPLFTETFEFPDDALVAKSSIDDIYAVMIKDLTEAEAVLPVKGDYEASDAGRATKGAARALLGKVYLYAGNYAAAEEWLGKVIDSDNYELVDDFNHIINGGFENNSESIFEVQFKFVGSGDVQTLWHYNYPQGIGGGFGNQLPTQDLVDEFEDYTGPTAINGKDPRLFYSIWRNGDPFAPASGDPALATYSSDWSATGYNMRKGLVPFQATNQGGTNKPILRYAGVLLMYAEAANELDTPAMRIAARAAVNEVRQRPSVGMPPLTILETDTKQEMFEAIVHERRVELAFEQQRFNDLRRWGLAEQYLGDQGYTDERNRYFPLPQEEIDTNPQLEQIPGW